MTILYDLDRLAAYLPDEQRSLLKKIRRWKDAHSVSADLDLASDYLDRALRLHLTKEGDLDLVKMALVHAAVMAYARAVERKSNHRGTLTISSKLSSAQLQMHKTVCDLRDESIRHFGPAGTDEPWNQDRALLIQEGDKWQPVSTARRKLFQRDFARELLLHLQSIRPIILEIIEERRAEFQTLFNETATTEAFALALKQCRLSEEEAQEFAGPVLNTGRQGRIWVNT
jgi:hypothetical protein